MYGIFFVLEVAFELLLHVSANLGSQSDIHLRRSIQKHETFDETLGVTHFLDCTPLQEVAYPHIAPVLAGLGLNHVLNDWGQFGSESRVQLLDYLFVAVHSILPSVSPFCDLGEQGGCDREHQGRSGVGIQSLR